MLDFSSSVDVCLGIDVGKVTHRACAVLSCGTTAFNVPLLNTEKEVDQLLSRASELGRVLVVVDQRRNIGLTVIRRARTFGMQVAYLPGIAMSRAASLFPGDVKTDERDAEIIARTALGVPQSLRPIPNEDQLEGARRLEAQRSDLLRDKTHQINRLRAILLESNPVFEQVFDPESTWCLKLLITLGGPWQILDGGKRRFSALSRRVSSERAEKTWHALFQATRPEESQVRAEAVIVKIIAKRILEDLETLTELSALIEQEVGTDETYQCLLTIPGIGPRTAAQLVLSVHISDFPDHHHLASYCGLVPKNRQSGISLNSVTASKQGNKQLKNLLIFSCASLTRSQGYYRDFYDSCRSRGMPYKAALKAMARKRLKVIYAVMRDRRPYEFPKRA